MSVVLVATTKTRIGSMMMMMWTLPRWRTDVLDVFLFVELRGPLLQILLLLEMREEDETPRQQRRLFLVAVSFVADDAVAVKVIII
jgi:hypothetical protein